MTDDEQQRRREAFIRRNRVARQQLLQATFRSDENVDNDPVTNFGKALNHDGDGIPTEAAHRSLVGALEDGSVGAFNDIVGADGEGELRRRLIEPHGSLEFQKSGVDPHMPRIRPHPSFSSEQTGAEMVELYWRALCRDMQYGEYGSDGTVGSAVTELGGLSGYNGPGSDADPRISNGLDHSNLFRGIVPGTQKGLRISQFLWKDIPRGAIPLSQRIQVTRHIIKGRDLAQKVRRQVPYLSIRDAAEILLGMGVPYDPNIPYEQDEASATDGTDGIQTGKPFINFGSHDILDVVVNVFISGQNVCWYRKWQVHRRLRPEEYGGRIHAHKERDRSFPIPDNVLDSTALSTVESTHDSYLLPQAYTEGSPTHPSFPAGHSGVAGATVTVLKAMFDGNHEFTNDEMVVPDADGTTDADLAHGDTATDVQQTKLETIDSVSGGTVAATGSEIDDAANSTVTVNDELNKLAANMALGRNWAGIHYRTDGIDGFLLGEQAAVRYLQDHIRQHDLPFDGYRLEPFFDKYPGTLDDAESNLHGGQILIKPEEIVNLGGMEGVDDPLE
jgi:membrane-associated phospholipid phosphatase